MGKVSIGLRGWRFEEDEVFADDGALKPMDELSADTRKRLARLSALVGSPCDACWLIHGDENLTDCNPVEVVYGEPLGEVAVCADHEADFLYWFSEAGGSQYRGEQELQDHFHDWFADGGRAPEGYGGVEHVDTDPENLPDPPEPDLEAMNVEIPEEERKRIDLREYGDDAESESDADGSGADEEQEDEAVDLEESDLDLGQDYPS